MRKAFSLVLLVLFISFAAALTISVLDPVKQVLAPGQEVDLGVIGPGQKVEIQAQRFSGEDDLTNAQGGEALWDRFDALTLPSGWSSEASKEYEDPMHAFVIASRDAADGDYLFSMKAVDYYQGAADLVFNAKVLISKDVLKAELKESTVESGPGQPATFFVQLENTGSASDLFFIEVLDLPNQWRTTRQVFVPFKSEQSVPIEVTGTESGSFDFRIKVTSLSSDKITQTLDAKLVLQPSLKNDLKAVSNGLLLFPNVQQTIYSLLGFIVSALDL
ncbi:MAG: hypothetical protein V1834_01215 [Candidatus Micrarchaeota archaeon]